jgi:uncharacterized protein (DUF433 family)
MSGSATKARPTATPAIADCPGTIPPCFGFGFAAFWGMKLLERITVEPGKCGGRPCIRGLRIRVTDILGMLAEGVSHEEVLRDFPYLEPDDIKAALAYAARQADHAVLEPT